MPPLTCSSGKHPHRNKAEARRHARRFSGADVYRCPECHAWHMTSPEHVKRREALRPRRPMSADEAFAELERLNRERTGG